MYTPKDLARIEAEFDCFCKRVLRNEAIDYFRKKSSQEEHSIPSEPSKLHAALISYDTYPSDFLSFDLPNGLVAHVKDDALCGALAHLPQVYREIVLLSYMHDLSDQKISTLLGLSRRTTQRLRIAALEQLRQNIWEI